MSNYQEQASDDHHDAWAVMCEMGTQLQRIRDIITEWNFGPMQDRDAINAIFSVVGDNCQPTLDRKESVD